MKLYKHQQDFINQNPDKSLLCWGTGTGKTLAAIIWGHEKVSTSESDYNKGALVIVPKSVKEKWIRDIEVYADSIEDPAPPMLFTVMTKEEFRRDWDKIEEFAAIIVDEAHYFAGMRGARQISQMARNLLAYNKKWDVPYILLATATPYLSTPYNIFMLAKILGHDWNYRDFKKEFFEISFIGARMIFVPRGGIEDDIADLVKDIGDVVHLDECADVPPQVFESEHFALTPKQEKAIKKVDDINHIVRFTQYHQIENGTLKGNEYEDDQHFPNLKTDRILDLVRTNKKIAVVCRYNLQIAQLKELLEKEGKKVFIINGATKDKDAVVQEVEKASEGVVLINAMASEGYELPSVPVMVFASMSFSYKDYKQIIGRLLRINKLKKNVYIHLISEGGVDQGVYDAIMKKQDFDIAIYDKK